MTTVHDNRYHVLTIGRIGIDIYPLEDGVGLEHVETFGKYVGGSDPFGRYAHKELQRLGVDDRNVGASEGLNAPVTFCGTSRPTTFPFTSTAHPSPPIWCCRVRASTSAPSVELRSTGRR